jgi:hypothetical protein
MWGLSPGYSEDLNFDRAIIPTCLFCHCNQAEPVGHSLNRYREPVFSGYAIGCERCHGPGELHVAARDEGLGDGRVDDTIVNPRHLEPALRDAVCQQCHLEGERRVLRRGRQPFDYRPGLPIQLFWSVFTRPPETIDQHIAVSQFEQMYLSRCYQASNGRMGCTTCHDPHAKPAADQAPAFYRDRCLACHNPSGCGMPSADRLRQNGDNCTACHMPRRDTADIAHAALTDHRVPRRGDQAARPSPVRQEPEADTHRLVYFHRQQADPRDPDVSRDLGLALAQAAQENRGAAQRLAAGAVPLLEASLRTWPDDVPAAESLAGALLLLRRPREAADACARVLAVAPEREQTLHYAAQAAAALKRFEDAEAYWHRALTINPWFSSYRYGLANHYSYRQKWPCAIDACREALRRNPHHRKLRTLLIYCLANAGDNEQARAEFQTLLRQKPGEADTLRAWFDSLSR